MNNEAEDSPAGKSEINAKDEEHMESYTNWINSKLLTTTKGPKVVENILEDLCDGLVLIDLVEALLKLKRKLPREKGGSKIQRKINVETVLSTLEKENFERSGISSDKIADGNKQSILGLVWKIICYYQQVSMVLPPSPGEEKQLKPPPKAGKKIPVEKHLIKWAQKVLERYSDVVTINDITKSWCNGLAFLYILYEFCGPNVIDVEKAKEMEDLVRLEYVFTVAEEELKVHRLLKPSDFCDQDVERHSVFKRSMLLYMFSLYEALRDKERVSDLTELSEWRKEYNNVIKWIETTEKKLIAEGEPATDYEDLLKKCSDLEELVNEFSNYESRVVGLLKKGDQLAKEPSIEENDRTQIKTDIKLLQERWDKLKKDREEQKKRAVLVYFNNVLSQCSQYAVKMFETVTKSLRPPVNDLPGIRVQCASLKALERRIEKEEATLTDIQENVNKMVGANVLPQDDFAETLNKKCEEVRKEQQVVKNATTETKRKLHYAFLMQYNRMQKEVTMWLKQCEKNERNVNIDNLKDLDQTYIQFTKLKQVKFLFTKGQPKYITLGEVHKEAVEGKILTGEEEKTAGLQLGLLTKRHNELQKLLNEKEQNLHLTLAQFMNEILDSVEEKVKEGENWVEPEDLADNFAKAKEQQDLMKKRQLVIKGRQTEILNELKRVDIIATSDVFPEKERSAIHRRINDLKQRYAFTIHAAKDKAYNYENIMVSWQEFRENLLAVLEWVNEKERQLSECKNQVNFVDKDKVKEHIQQLKVIQDGAEAQRRQTKLNESGKKLISLLGKDSAEVSKQMEEVDSCRKDFNDVVEQHHDKIESGEHKIKDFYSNMDDVSEWLDSTDDFIDTCDDKKPQGDDETEEEKFSVMKDQLLAKRKQVLEKQETFDEVIKCVKDLDGVLDERSMKIAQAKANKLTDRWNIVIKRMETFFSHEKLNSN